MSTFPGFPTGKMQSISIPDLFFTQLLPQINNLGELKITLYTFWYLSKQEGPISYLTYKDLAADQRLMDSLGEGIANAESALDDALQRAVQRGSLLKSQPDENINENTYYFLNSERGRAAIKAICSGDWIPSEQTRYPITIEDSRPNIFQLYEENIGPLTPLIAEDLTEAEQLYAQEWIEEAFHKAVQNNVRRWRYIEAILKSWQEEGRHDTYQKNSEEDRFRYIKGKYGDIGEH